MKRVKREKAWRKLRGPSEATVVGWFINARFDHQTEQDMARKQLGSLRQQQWADRAADDIAAAEDERWKDRAVRDLVKAKVKIKG